MTKAPKKTESEMALDETTEMRLLNEDGSRGPNIGEPSASIQARLAALEAYVKANVKALGWPEFEG